MNGGYVVGHGVDVVDLPDFSRLFVKPGRDFLGDYFTAQELLAAGQGNTRTEKLASRFAIKEAVLKALGVGWGDGVAFTDVEVLNGATGAPNVRLYRKLAEYQEEREIVGWFVSASHSSSVAFGSAIAIGRPRVE